MRVKERYELAAEMSERYRVATKAQRGALLNAFCLTTGYERKHAIKVLGGRRRKSPVSLVRAAAAAMGWSSSER
jgi:hypothetical protein